MQEHLSKLRTVKEGESLREALTANFINGIVGALKALARGENVKSGAFTRKSSGSDWVMVGFDKKASPSSGGGTTLLHPFQPIFPVPWTGGGDAPPNQQLKFKIRPGFVQFNGTTLFPSNKNDEFLCPASNDTGYYAWLKVGLAGWDDESSLGYLDSLIYESGTTVPDAEQGDTETGAPPDTLYLPLFYVTSTSTAIDNAVELIFSPMTLEFAINNIQCGSFQRSLSWKPISAINT